MVTNVGTLAVAGTGLSTARASAVETGKKKGLSYRWQVPTEIESSRSIPANRFLITAAGG